MASAKKPAAKKPAAKAAAKKPVAARTAAAKPAASKAAATKPVAQKAAAAKPAAASKPAAAASKPVAAAKAPATAAAAKKPAAAKRKPNAAFLSEVKPSAALAAVVGDTPMPRTEITRKLWDYIKQNNLQDPANRRMINADDKLRPIFGKDQVSMFEMTALVSKQLS